MLSQDKKVFKKREIDEKYRDIWKGKKKKISIQQLKDLGQKFKLKDMIVQDKKGCDHRLYEEVNNELSSEIKLEEVIREGSLMEASLPMDNNDEGSLHPSMDEKE